MRIEQLHLLRYGKFTGQTLDFGPSRPSRPDLHLVLGPNEAGKTTTLNAWLDLLYGMGLTNPYAFLHGYDAMRVGARIAINGEVRDYVRLKRNKNSLLDGDGAPVSEEALLQAMNGLGRAAYANMFSMDARALEEGGREALESRGQLGEMLYSASAGLGAVAATLGHLTEAADGFWKPRSRKSELAQLKAQIIELRDRRAQIDTTEATYARCKKELETSVASYQQAATRLGQLEQRIHAAQNLLAAIALQPKLSALRSNVAALPVYAPAPSDWSKRAGELRVADAETRTLIQMAREQEAELTRRLAELALDPAALALADELEQARLLQTRHVTAAIDIPKLRHDLELNDRQLADLLRQLDQPSGTDPASLLLPAHVAQTLRELMESRKVLEAQLREARREHEEARLALAELADGDEDAPAGADDETLIARLGALADSIRQEGFDRRINAARRDAAHAREALAQRLQVLAPWRGEAAELAALQTPAPSVLDGLARALGEATRQRDALDETIAAADDDLHRLAAELDGIVAVTGEADDAAHLRARAQREQAWAAHRSALTVETADAFEAAMRADDMIAETRLTRQRELARAAQLRQDQARRSSQRTQLLARRSEYDAAIAQVRAQTAALAAGISPLLAGLSAPDELAAWLQRRVAALEARAPALEAAHALDAAEAQRAEAASALRRLLPTGAHADDDLPELLEAAQALIAAATERRQRRDAIARATRNLEQRQRSLQRVENDLAGWETRWRAACGGCWLGRGTAAQDVALATAQVRAALDLLSPLEKLLLQRQDLTTRIAKMERDQKQFTEAAARLAQRAAPDGAEAGPDDALDAAAVFRRLEARVAAANEAERRRRELQEELERNQHDLREVLAKRAQLEAEVSQMAQHFGVDGIVDIQNALEACEKRAVLGAQLDELEQQAQALTGAASPGEADRVLAEADQGALTAEVAALREEQANTQTLLQELFAERRKAEQALAAIGPDSAAAQLDAQRQTLMLDIAEKTRAWLRLRLGVAAAERGLSLWRESHRSAMLRHASEAFSHMSCGAWAGLEAHPAPSGEMLMAVDHQGVARKVEHLSKGARFQLYLALRIAAYREFADARTPPPFVADDIMETFDDDRAAATFDLLSAMARHGQVIYLTHHAHLCEIARARCPDVLIHKLSS